MMTDSSRPNNNTDRGQWWSISEVGAPNDIMIVNLYTGTIMSGVQCKTL